MSGPIGIANLKGMRGRKKGGLRSAASIPTTTATPKTLPAHAEAFLEHLAVRAYSKGSIDSHRWAFNGFLEWAQSQELVSPSAFSRATMEDYQLYLHQYRSPRTKQPLVVNTQLSRLGCIRRLFAWLCRTGVIPANPATDLDLPRKQSPQLPKCLSPEEIERLLALPNVEDAFGLRNRTILEKRRRLVGVLDRNERDVPRRGEEPWGGSESSFLCHWHTPHRDDPARLW